MTALPLQSPLFSHLDSLNKTSTDVIQPPTSPYSRKESLGQQQSNEPSGSRSYENGVVAQSLTPTSETGPDIPVTLDEDFPEPICGGCNKLIDEDSADAGVIHFATQLWHVDCFRCAKCHNLVTTDCDDILLLSDGNPICGQCNYSCQICGLPIMEEAIMTGDESYHAACFTCRSCHSPIAELVFAKTSQGIYCMKCHNQRVARSRRHADKKKGSSRSKQMESKAAPALGEDRSPSQSTSLEDGLLTASESDPVSARTMPISPSSSSLSPYPKQGTSSAGSIGKRPLHPPPASPRERRDSSTGLPWTSAPTTASEATSSHSHSLTHLTQSEASPRTSSSRAIQSAASDNELNTRKDSPNQEEGQAKAVAASGLGIRAEEEVKRSREGASPALEAKRLLATPTIIHPSSGSEGEVEADGDDAVKKVQYKRASRLNVHGGSNGQEENRLSKSFSFYDPDIVSLMDSMTQFGSSEDLSLDGLPSRGQLSERLVSGREEKQGRDKADEEGDTPSEQQLELPPKIKRHDSNHSLRRISMKMRESMKEARDGNISMDTKFVESVLEDLDATRARIKTLQKKYEQIRRASQQAAQGFSSAKEEYEHEVQARYDAEAEMINLKRQLHLQASKLTEMTQEKKQHESLQRRSHLVKHSIQGMERDLAKLTVERDLTVAEVAELVALQDGRSLPSNGNEENVKRALTLRLEGVKDRYRQELNELRADKDSLLIEIEELRQTRDQSAEETQSLQRRNEELSATLALLTRRVDHAQMSASIDGSSPNRPYLPPKGNLHSSTASFGFGFGRQGRTNGTPSSINTSATETVTGPNNSPLPPEPNEKIIRLAPVPIAKAEAIPKKFKWKKAPKLTAETARTAGQQLAAGLQGVINPSPPVPPKASTQQSSPFSHATSLSMQQQQQQQHIPSGTASQQNSTDQSFAFNGHSNGSSNGEVVIKEHLFQPFSVLRPTRCFACQKNMWGQSETRCALCNQVCHIRCLHSLPTSCNQPFTRSDEAGIEYTGPSMFGRSLTEQIQSEGADRKTPLVVTKCIQAVEHLGMDYEGIYRKSGGTSQLKIITQLFENRQPFNLENRDRFNDISAITSVLKNYFRELPEPLLTFDLHQKFITCTESKQEAVKKEAEMRELVQQLPKEHFDTLKILIDHLHRVQDMAEENRMNSRNLGVVFGPTLMRSADPALEFAHMGGKAMTIEFMIDNPQIFD